MPWFWDFWTCPDPPPQTNIIYLWRHHDTYKKSRKPWNLFLKNIIFENRGINNFENVRTHTCRLFRNFDLTCLCLTIFDGLILPAAYETPTSLVCDFTTKNILRLAKVFFISIPICVLDAHMTALGDKVRLRRLTCLLNLYIHGRSLDRSDLLSLAINCILVSSTCTPRLASLYCSSRSRILDWR